MTHNLTCSVVVPTYNRMTLLGYTLDSLVRQSLPADQFEVLVVDDGSSDDTRSVVAGYQDRLNLRYFFQDDEGYRVAKARNVGIAHARADVVVMIDSGVLAHSNCLAAHLASHRDAGPPVAVIGYVYGFNTNNEDAEEMIRAIRVDDVDATIAGFAAQGRWPDIREDFYAAYNDIFHHLPAPWVMFWTCNVSAPTAALRAIGGFDETFTTWGGEDLDLAYRLHRDGARIVLNRAACTIHYPHEKSMDEHNDIAEPNHWYIAGKYATPITQLLTELRAITPLDFNEVILARGLPRCADFVAGRLTETTR